MSESENPSSDDIEQYRSTTGVDSKFADVAGDDHALKERFGSDEEAKRIEFEAEIIGERIAEWYDDPAAAIREYLSNAETACIRRARHELLEAGHGVPDDTREMLDAAREKCDYDPVIEVTYNQKRDSTRFIIEDNGVGISTDEYLVLKKIGYSTSHMDGDRLGQFGMGYMSGFQLVGTEGVFNMRTRSFLSEETYSTANYITNFEYLDGLRDQYGTRFEFPSFCDKAQGFSTRNKVEEYADGMRVTVLYREMDGTGQEIFNEDYTPRTLEDDYPDDSVVITHENEHFKAVMSNTGPDERSYITYNISMPIRRNAGGYRSDPRLDAPWKWDFRGKAENGPIVASDDDSVVGLAPVSDTKYENLPDERKDSFIPRSEVPSDAITMPAPASSRDSYESNHDEFWEYVSELLHERWMDMVAEKIDSLGTFDDFKDADSQDKKIIVEGYNMIRHNFSTSQPDDIVDGIDNILGIDIDTDAASKLKRLREKHHVVPRSATNPQHKSETRSRRAWRIIDNFDGDVYIGKTISPKKANIVWALDDDNVVVRVDPDDSETTGECYQRLQKLWGWKKLKDVPTRNLKEKLPDLPDDVAEKYENTSSKQIKKQQPSSRRTSRDPKTKKLKVYGRRRQGRRGYRSHSAETIYDKMDNGEEIDARRFRAERIMLFDENETKRSTAKQDVDREARVGVVVAPKYVYKYLKDAENVYTSVSEMEKDERQNATITLHGDREVPVVDIPDDELILLDSSSLRDRFDGRRDDLREWFEDYNGTDYNDLTFLDSDKLEKFKFIDPQGGTIYRFSRFGTDHGERFDKSERHIIKDILLPDNIDWNNEFMQTIDEHGRIKDDVERTAKVAEFLQENDCLPTT